VVLIALLALARKFIVLDIHETTPRLSAGPCSDYSCAGRDLLAHAGA
jgi:hypothetical protein